MPSYLDFNSTSQFRDSILARTLQQPNGPQTFTSSAYSVENLRDQPNIDPGEVDTNLQTYLAIPDTRNTFTADNFDTVETLRDLTRLEDLGLYPYFTQGSYGNFISIMTTDNYDQESNMMKFAARHIRENEQGPVLARITQNLVAATYGRVRLIDALEGNTATAINLITGKESLVEKNYKITVAKTLPGKAIDFLQTVAGVEFPWSEIPGDYLSNPANPVNYRPEAQTTAGQIIQDITGVLGSLIGIQRRPKLSAKPSDLMIDYMGSGQKDVLFDNLRFSRYAPDYSKSARSQQSSKLFNFPNVVGDAINDVLGLGAPTQGAYIGDDRGEDVKYAMGDFNDNIVRSSYYLSLMFDPVQTQLFERQRPITQGGPIGGNLTWYSTKSQNKLGEGNAEYNFERSQLEDSLSTRYNFRSDSIMGKTQELIETMPSDGGAARSHVANAIDQTSRIFREGNTMISRGSAVKYVDKYGQETGVEYCRVWTKDDPYMNMSDTMKRTGNIRKFDSSVMTKPWNLNIAPMSNGQGSFEGSTNIVKQGDSYVAKKYMFSIENLAWKTSTLPGYTYSDLPYCERGPNGGRVMWFPPYDIKVNEQNNARWETNTFLGRPEPIYTYQQTERSGQISFKVVVDHPSILNLLVQKVFKGMSDEESENYINAFFAGCEEVDFYSLIRTYTTLTKDDLSSIKRWLEGGNDQEEILKYKIETEDLGEEKPDTSPQPQPKEAPVKMNLYFPNDFPRIGNSQVQSPTTYEQEYENYKNMFEDGNGNIDQSNGTYFKDLDNGLNLLFSGSETATKKNDKKVIFGRTDVTGTTDDYQLVKSKIESAYNTLKKDYKSYTDKTDELVSRIEKGEIKDIKVQIFSSTSSIAGDDYNVKLSLRRAHSIYKDVVSRIAKKTTDIDFTTTTPPSGTEVVSGGTTYTFEKLGYEGVEGSLSVLYKGVGENATTNESTFGGGDVNIDCHTDEIQSNSPLKRTAPPTFYCRHGIVQFDVKPADVIPDIENKIRVKVTPDPITPPKQKPRIDEMKKIIMKTLSECYYFKVMEEDSPVTFKSLTEKLKYFHPAFHSTTPEGLNSRLTFLLQCVRPGDTIPLKGIADNNDINARNTSFGPPPICVVRIGDFYHSKIVVRDVNINYDDGVWDMNPEGIGVQPMIANVTMQVNFIGGQGLEKPVERLQNALSSNFFANTEMYDPRSVSTNSTIDGQDAAEFTKEFLESLQKAGPSSQTPNQQQIGSENEITQGKYIGGSGEELSYGELISSLDDVEGYFETYKTTYNDVLTSFGPQVHSLVFSPNYRSINKYDVYTTNTSTREITMFGEFDPIRNSFDFMVNDTKAKLNAAINDLDVSTMMKFDRFLSSDKLERSNYILREKLTELVESKLDELISLSSLKDLASKRNKIISSLDKLNYLTKYVSDGKIDDGNGTQADLSGFTFSSLYEQYDHIIDYFDKNYDEFEKDLDTSVDFTSLGNMGITTLSEILSVLLYGKEEEIKNIYKEDTTIFPQKIFNKISKKIDNFFEETKEERIRLKKFKPKKNESPSNFGVVEEIEISSPSTQLDELIKVHSSKVTLGTKLNFYKP
jgi:outer membrane protein OmpA-like peptidoglycan-associated protein